MMSRMTMLITMKNLRMAGLERRWWLGGGGYDNTQIIEEGKEEEEKEEEIENNEEQEDAQDVNEEAEVNAGRPRHQAMTLPTKGPPRSMLQNNNDEESMIHLEATLVTNKPVYDGVPLEPVLV